MTGKLNYDYYVKFTAFIEMKSFSFIMIIVANLLLYLLLCTNRFVENF